MAKDKLKKIEERMDKIELLISDIQKAVKGKENNNLTCKKCKHSWTTKSKYNMVSCPSCGTKNKNPLYEEEEDEPFNAFEGKRYEDYDDKFMKDICFKKKKKKNCGNCGKEINYEDAYWGYNRLRCKKCYEKLSKSNHDEVKKMVERF